MVEYIKEQDSLNTGRKTINEELTRSNNNANKAKIDSAEALLKAIAAMDLSESVRNQLNQILIEGDSSVEAAAARVDEKNVTHDTLKERIDDGFLGVTSQLNDFMANLLGYVKKNDEHINVKYFGAVGDGVTDDTVAIQNALDSANGAVVYFPAGVYLIKDTLNVDASKVRGLIGNGAYISAELSENQVAIIYQGGLTTGSAGPGGQTSSLSRSEHSPFVTGLKIIAKNRHVGTGLLIKGLLAPILTNVSILSFSKALELTDRLRNIIISSCHIWDNQEYGIHYNNVNLHQSNIIGCHISYSKHAFAVDGGDVHNLQITGCDIEGAGSDKLIYFKHINSGEQISQVQIVGNSIEDHLSNIGELIYIEGRVVANSIGIEITGNELSGSNYHAIHLNNSKSVAITGNSFINIGGGSALHLSGSVASITFGNNTAYVTSGKINKNVITSDANGINGLMVNNNNFDGLTGYALKANQQNSAVFDVNISGNVFVALNATENEFSFVDVYANTLVGLILKGNGFRIRDYHSSAVKIRWGGGGTSHMIIKDNYARGISGSDKYDIPEISQGSVIIKDNV